MKKRTLVRAVVFFVVSVALIATAANAVFAEDDQLYEIPLPEHGDGSEKIVNIGGVGTTNYIPKFVNNTNLGNSVLYELGGNVGIGTTNPGGKLEIYDANGPVARLMRSGTNFGVSFKVRGSDENNEYLDIGATHDTGAPESNVAMSIGNGQSGVRVGIGTTNPEAKLHVNGVVEGVRIQGTAVGESNNAYATFYNAGGIRIGYVGDGSSGDNDVFLDADLGNVSLLTSAGRVLTATSTGNVGIGTSAPGYQLQVMLPGGTTTGNIVAFGSNDIPATFLFERFNDGVFGTAKFKSAANHPIELAPGGATAMYMKTDGNVGIGTLNPRNMLDVDGVVSAQDGFRVYGDLVNFHELRHNNYTGALEIAPINGTNAVFPNGNVGIGTATPSQKLDVAGYVKGQSGLCIGDDCRTAWPSGGGGGIGGSGSTNYLAKFTGTTSIGNGAIYDNGNVGIGTTSPLATLHVNGTQRIDSSTTGNALYIASGGSGSHAIRAKANSTDAGAAIYAETASGNNSSAVWAKSGATTIYGETWGEGFTGGSDVGVHGLAAASTSTGGATLGVLGESRSIPVAGSDTSNGVFGWGGIGGTYGRTYGVWGETDSKGPPSGENGPVSGVTGVAANNVSGLQSMGVVGRTSRASSSSFGVYYQGGISGTGLMTSIVRTNDGPRLIYATQSPEPWVEDYGAGKLKNGSARITLDPAYVQTITMNAKNPFHVFVTPTGTASLNGLRVIKDAAGFRVQELNGGKSSATFDWRVVAKRKDFENRRLDISEGAYSDPTLYPERFPDANLTHEGLQTVRPQE